MDSPTPKRSRDYSGIGILLSNAFAIVLALVQDWDLRPMLVIYWSQSVIIGVFNFWRIMKLRQFSTKGFTSNGKRVLENETGKRSTAWFFAMHYGMFHVGYLVFVLTMVFGAGEEGDFASRWRPSSLEIFWVISAIIAFLFGHAFSFVRNVASDLERRPNLGTMMFLPYARIIPMHLVAIFGAGAGSNRVAVFVFSLLKTGADYLMHIVEHRVLQKAPKKEAAAE
ncbi:MAG: DUF6498-containing protein [Verrucomicrobiota bacterium]